MVLFNLGMQKKILLQIALFTLSTLVIIIIFNKYYNDGEKDLSNIPLGNTEIFLKDKNNENTIKEIYYISKNNKNVYEIMSKTGNVDLQNPSIILMKDVIAKITFINSAPIDITSKFAKYNNNTYETKFFKNVLVQHLDHKINADAMNISMADNLATLNKNIVYKNSSTKLIADKVEIDLLTKDAKIFMDNDYKKVQIISGKQ